MVLTETGRKKGLKASDEMNIMQVLEITFMLGRGRQRTVNLLL